MATGCKGTASSFLASMLQSMMIGRLKPAAGRLEVPAKQDDLGRWMRGAEVKGGRTIPVLDLRDRIASALDACPTEIVLRRFRISPGGRSAQCWGRCDRREMGRWNGVDFFAKVFLADPYPIVSKLAAPWEGNAHKEPLVRPLRDQLRIEWNTTHRLRALLGDSVPAPLGCSEAAKTIVWEDVPAAWVIETVKRSRLVDPRGLTGAGALYEAGAWLHTLHDRSLVGNEQVDTRQVADAIRAASEMAWHQRVSNVAVATIGRFLDEAVERTGGQFPVPNALGHGDFTLANLMWNRKGRRLFVIDYENFAYRSVCYDLLTMVFDIRLFFLNPWVPRRVPVALEAAFWRGYGTVSSELRSFVSAVASATILGSFLPQMKARRERRSWLAGITTTPYKVLFEDAMVKRYCASVR